MKGARVSDVLHVVEMDKPVDSHGVQSVLREVTETPAVGTQFTMK